MRPDGPFSLEITNWFIWNYKLNKRCWLWTFTVIYQQRHEQYESWIAGNFYSAELARFLPNLSDALNMYSHGGQGRAQSDWISWQTLQERCLRFKLLSPFTKWESNKDTSVSLVAALFYPPFPLLFYHIHTRICRHTLGGWSELADVWVFQTLRQAPRQSPENSLHLWEPCRHCFESATDDNIFLSFSQFLNNCNNLLKMCCCKAKI